MQFMGMTSGTLLLVENSTVHFPHFSTVLFKRCLMKVLISAVISAFVLMSAPAFAGSHGGGKMDDKKVDCTKKENEKNKACEKKK
jgi:hypothetical protein